MDTSRQRKLVAALLKSETTLALATTDEFGIPLATPLFYIFDENLCLYWVSSNRSLHSRNLKREPRSSVAIYRHADHWREICGVQIRGTVSTVTDPMSRKEQIRVYSERFQMGTIFRRALALSTLYVFRPDCIRYIDNSRRPGYKFELTFEYPTETART